MDEFGETPTVYVWLTGHVEGAPLPDDFWQRLASTLAAGGFEYESV